MSNGNRGRRAEAPRSRPMLRRCLSSDASVPHGDLKFGGLRGADFALDSRSGSIPLHEEPGAGAVEAHPRSIVSSTPCGRAGDAFTTPAAVLLPPTARLFGTVASVLKEEEIADGFQALEQEMDILIGAMRNESRRDKQAKMRD